MKRLWHGRVKGAPRRTAKMTRRGELMNSDAQHEKENRVKKKKKKREKKGENFKKKKKKKMPTKQYARIGARMQLAHARNSFEKPAVTASQAPPPPHVDSAPWLSPWCQWASPGPPPVD